MYLKKTADADDHVTRSNCMAPLLRRALVLLKALGQALTFAFDKSQVKAQPKIWINLELCPQFLAVWLGKMMINMINHHILGCIQAGNSTQKKRQDNPHIGSVHAMDRLPRLVTGQFPGQHGPGWWSDPFGPCWFWCLLPVGFNTKTENQWNGCVWKLGIP